MANWSALSLVQHRNSGWKKFTSYGFAKKDAVASLLMAELSHAIPYYPIGFIKNAENKFELVAIQSLQAGLNLYVDQNGRWLAPYVPSIYRGYPFRLIEHEGSLIFCVDEDSEAFHQEIQAGDINIVNIEKEELSEDLSKILDFHKARYQNQLLTQRLVDDLADAEVIVPWKIELKNEKNTEATEVSGLFKVDESLLKKLTAEKVNLLQKSGALGLAYGQLFSQLRINDFGQRYEYFNKVHQKPLEVDLDKLFGEDDDGIKF